MPILTKARSTRDRTRKANDFLKVAASTCKLTCQLTCMSRSGRKRKKTSTMFKPPKVLVLYPGMPLMLRINICPSIGLSNGSIGYLVAVVRNRACIAPHESIETAVSRAVRAENASAEVPALLVRFPNCYKGVIGALTSDGDMDSKRNAAMTVLIEGHTFERVHGLPLSPAHAMTIYKSQSLTLPYVIIDPSCPDMGQLYVAFSRSPSLQRIALISRLSQPLLNKFSSHCLTISQRLQLISDCSTPLLPFVSFVQGLDAGLREKMAGI